MGIMSIANILISLPERDEYVMLCTQNCSAPKNNSLKHSTYRAKHWETKDYNHPHHCGGDQDNKSHTMDGNTNRITQIQYSNNSNPLLCHPNISILHSTSTPSTH